MGLLDNINRADTRPNKLADALRGFTGLLNTARPKVQNTLAGLLQANPLQDASQYDPGYMYADMLPIKKNLTTKELSPAVPGLLKGLLSGITAPARAYNGEIDTNGPQGIAEANNLAMNLFASSAPGMLRQQPLGQLNMFAGTSAKTADLAKQGLADKMLASGDDPAKVWAETGWGKGPDGKWRFEIPDNGAYAWHNKKATSIENKMVHDAGTIAAKDKLNALDSLLPLEPKELEDFFNKNPDQWAEWQRLYKKSQGNEIEWKKTTIDKAGNILDHDPLWDAYDGAYDINTRFGVGPGYAPNGSYGQNWLGTGQESIDAFGTGKTDATSSLIHELQHAIQEREGFARGGSADQIKRNPYQYANPDWVEYAKSLPAYEKQATDALKQDFINSYVGMRLGHPSEVYQRLGGEAEARLTQSRMNMDAAQRAAQYPWEPGYFQQATGVPLNNLIMRGVK